VLELDAMAERSIKEPAFAVYREIQSRVEECMRLDAEWNRKHKQRKAGTWQDRKSVARETAKKKVSRSLAAARYFADLNTLEFMLLAAGILICLAGIMFQAALADTRALVEGQKAAVTVILIIVVLLSLLYYFLFLVAEISPGLMTSIIIGVRKCWNRNDKTEDEEEAFYADPNVNLAENPMFAGNKPQKADNSAMRKAVDEQLSELQKAEIENQRLREEIKNRKVEAQLEETKKQKPTNLAAATPFERKEFAQAQLKDKLTGPKKQKSVKREPFSEEEKARFNPDADI